MKDWLGLKYMVASWLMVPVLLLIQYVLVSNETNDLIHAKLVIIFSSLKFAFALIGLLIAFINLIKIQRYLSIKSIKIIGIITIFFSSLIFLELRTAHITEADFFKLKEFSNDFIHPHPYVGFKGNPANTKFNANGYFGAVPVKGDTSLFKVFIIGNSNVLVGNPPISDILSGKIDSIKGKKVVFYNYGVLGSNSTMDLSRLLHEVIDYAPDFLVVLNGANDILLGLSDESRIGYPFNYGVTENNPILKSANELDIVPLMLYKSHFARLFFREYFQSKFGSKSTMQADEYDDWTKEVVNHYVKNSRKIQSICDTYNVKCMIGLQPIDIESNSIVHKSDVVEDFLEGVHEELKLDTSVNYFNLNHHFSGDSAVFKDVIHLTDMANGKLTDVLLDKIQDQFLKE